MAYEVLARKYRPETFADLTGQQVVTDTLRHAIQADRVAHAYLLCGPRGTGKTTTARIFAKALNCAQGPTPDPCGECEACRSIARGSFPDVIEIDAASNTGVDSVRELREEASYRPMQGRAKVYIIDEVHQLSKPAFNALLKTLEEPPEHVKFIFATTEPHKVIETVLSRCQVLKLSALSEEHIAQRLDQIFGSEGIQAEAGVSAGLAARARGGMRDALTLADQLLALVGDAPALDDLEKLSTGADHKQLDRLVRTLLAGDRAELLRQIPPGESAAEEICAGLLQHLRIALVLAHCGQDAPFVEASKPARQELGALGAELGPDRLELMLEELLIARERMATLRGEARLVLELTLLNLSRPDLRLPLAELVERLTALEGRLAPGTVLPPVPRSAAPSASTERPAAYPAANPAPTRESAPARPERVIATNRAARTSAGEAWSAFLAELAQQAPTLGEVLERSGELVDFTPERVVIRIARLREVDRPIVMERRNQLKCERIFSALLGGTVEVRIETAEQTRDGGAEDPFTNTIKQTFGGRLED
ncbi:MAG: DNA polymerase III subunit gamma/tau [Planctomycetes bacterium]|nr:DNA polymerase III subunit gamma/tau [Planctomycetota bacterium]MCB9905667.1 DNA polymerase III subunit gamma/tau [Planctomycetota bacterium]